MGSSRSTRYRGLILCIEASAGQAKRIKNKTYRGKEKLQRAGHHNLYLMGRGMWNPIEMRETSSESALRLAGPSNPMSSFKREKKEKKKKKKNKRAFSRRREFKRAGAWVTGKRQERASKSFSELLPSAPHPVWCCHKQNRYCIWHGLHHLVIASDSRQKRVHQHGPKSEVDLFFFFFLKKSFLLWTVWQWHGHDVPLIMGQNWNFKPILLSRPAYRYRIPTIERGPTPF